MQKVFMKHESRLRIIMETRLPRAELHIESSAIIWYHEEMDGVY